MKYRSWLAIGIALTGLLSGCSRAQNPASARWDEAKARETALTIAKGWKFSPDDFLGSSASLQHNVYAVLPFDNSKTARWLLVVATAPPGHTCHACAPVTGAIVFAPKAGSWQAVYDQPRVLDLGAFGKPPSARIRSLDPSKPAVEFELGAMAQGFEATTLTLVAEVNQKLKEVLSLETEESNEAADMPPAQTFKWQAKVETYPTVNAGFPDIVVRYSGTISADNGKTIHPYSATRIYRFDGEVYRWAKYK
jgi:hypothetical protein